MEINLREKIKAIKESKLSAEENIRNFLEKIKKEDKKINSFIQLNNNALREAKEVDKKMKEGKAGKLAGLAIAVKSNINVRGLLATCASKTLAKYVSSYDATVIKKIKDEGAIIIGMTNCDEFACGSSGETSAFGPTENPSCLGKIPGGSSSGSAAAVVADFCDIAIGSDTGGSIRNPASHCGCVGIKPSYGRVSRYGLIDLAMSLDQVGPFSKDVYGAALLLNVISGKDEKDPTTFSEKVMPYHEMLDGQAKLSIGICPELQKLTSPAIREKIDAIIKKLKLKGWNIKEIELPYVNLAIQTYYPLVYVEFFSATRKFSGRLYGEKIEDTCGPEVLRRILGGSEISKKEYHNLYYRRALIARQLITEGFAAAFKKVDAVISGVVPRTPHKIGSSISAEEMYSYDALTIPANLSGICAASIPVGRINDCPIGLQIMCPAFTEARMLQIAKTIEDLNIS